MSKIVIVEDDPMLSEIYKKKFGDSGFEVFPVLTGSQALETAAKAQPDLVLLDLVLPEEDGFEILENIKADPRTKDLRVVIFSNLSQDEDKERATELGAIGFITKAKFTPQQVVEQALQFLDGDKREEIDSFMDSKRRKSGSSVAASAEGIAQERLGKKVLMLEDEEVFVEMFGKKIQEVGYDFEYATNGSWGLKKISEQKYDVIIADVVMPSMNGIEVIKKIREEGMNIDTPIIVFSNSVEEGQAYKAVGELIQGLYVKSQTTPSQLITKVNELLAV